MNPHTHHTPRRVASYATHSTLYYVLVCALIVTLTLSAGISYAQQLNAPEDDAKERADDNEPSSVRSETDIATVLFSARGDMYTFSDIVDNNFYKGMTLYFDAKAGVRYAVVSRSTTVDTLQRLVIKNISVYRDLYLGEDAGIVFTPQQDEQVVLTVFATGRLDGAHAAKERVAYRARTAQSSYPDTDGTQSGASRDEDTARVPVPAQNSVRAVPATPDTTVGAFESALSREESAKLGEYLVWVYQFPADGAYTNIPFATDATLSDEKTLAQRVADEYRVALSAPSRLYVRMSSQSFDSLLEVSDRYGRTIVSDDWGDEYSLITLEVPATDDYFVTATSFDGVRTGAYQIEGRVSTNELIEEVREQISPNSPKILQKYAYEYALNIGGGEYRAVEIHTLDSAMDFALVNESLQALYYESVPQGEEKVVPLYVAENGNYKLLLLNSQRKVSNFILRVFK